MLCVQVGPLCVGPVRGAPHVLSVCLNVVGFIAGRPQFCSLIETMPRSNLLPWSRVATT